MKRKLKGLAAIWLAAIMMLGIVSQNITVQAATDNIYYYIYTGTEPLQKGGRSCYKERIDIELDTPLNEQSEIMAYVDVPQGKLLSWRLWGGEYDSGWIYPVTDPVSKEAGEGVSQEERDALLEEALKEDPDIWWRSMIIEPYLLDKCRISQQPAASNAYTVKGEMTEDGTDWQETEDIAYQWYETQVKKKEYRVVDENAASEAEINCLGIQNGSYEGGFWRPGEDNEFGIAIPVTADDVVTVTPKEGVSLCVDGELWFEEQEDGTWTATAEEDDECAFYIWSEDGNTPECTIQVERTTVTTTLLPNQTTAALTAGEDGKQYFCRCTFNPGGAALVVDSDIVTYAAFEEPDIGIDYRTEELVGFETDGIYEINGKTVAPENGKLPVGNYIGMKDTELSIVRKGDTEHADSEPQVLTVSPYPRAPMNIKTVGETAKGTNDGKITGLTDGMEYRVSGAQTWKKLTADVSGTLAGLAPETYEVRIAATEESFASKKTVVTVAAYEEPGPEPPVKPSGTAPGRPPEVIYVDLSETEKVGDIGLSEQWQWSDQDKERSLGGLDVGDTMKVTAEYTGADRDSYETVTAETILYIVKGRLQNITNPEGNAFSGNLQMKQSELQNLLLDLEDKTQIEDGEDIYVYLTVDSLEDGEVPLSDKEQAARKLAELQADAKKQGEKVTFGAYMDVSLYKRIGNDSPKKVTKTNGMVEVTITIPEEWLNTGASVTRTFYILRVHNGVAELLKCRPGAGAGEYIFETDAFSTYALLYTDKTGDKGTKPPQTTEKPGTSGGGTKPPQTTETPAKKEDNAKEDEAGQSGNQIEKRTDLSLLLATGKQKGTNGIKLDWLKCKDVSGYEVYWSYCDGKKNFKKAKRIQASSKRTFTHKKLKKNRSYKYFIAAYQMVDGKTYYVAKSPTIHVAMKNAKRTNIKSIKVNKTKLTLKKGKSFKIKTKLILENKKKKPLTHAAKLRYYTDNKTVAVVSKSGKITAKKKGKCNIYVIANNGVSKKIKVTVK